LKRLLPFLMVGGFVVAGCGGTQQAYNEALIKQVGGGSTAVESLVPTIQAAAKVSGAFSDPTTQQATTYLAEGQLDKLTAADLVRMASANRTAATNIGGVLATFDRLATSISAASVDASSVPNLADGSKTFVTDWNQYLTTTADELRTVRRALTGMTPVYDEFQSLLRAAYNTSKLKSTVQFDKVRHAVLQDIAQRVTQMQNAAQGLRGGSAVEQRLVKFVDGNQEAQAIVTKVNQEYPNGFLAQEFTKN